MKKLQSSDVSIFLLVPQKDYMKLEVMGQPKMGMWTMFILGFILLCQLVFSIFIGFF